MVLAKRNLYHCVCDIKILCWMVYICLVLSCNIIFVGLFLTQGFKFLNFMFAVYYLITGSAAQYLGMPQHLHENFNF